MVFSNNRLLEAILLVRAFPVVVEFFKILLFVFYDHNEFYLLAKINILFKIHKFSEDDLLDVYKINVEAAITYILNICCAVTTKIISMIPGSKYVIG